jgi:uncharacterized protein YndB with AHSA1/START domain
MGVIEVAREILIAAPRNRVWEILADHEGMTEWFPAREVILRRRGAPDPNGVGAVRVARLLGFAVEEWITAFKPEERMEYGLTAGAPVRDHRAEVVLSTVDGETRVTWSVALRPKIPATRWLLERALSGVLRDALAGLKRRAERP